MNYLILKKYTATKKQPIFWLCNDEGKIIRTARDYMSLVRFLNQTQDEFDLELINYAA